MQVMRNHALGRTGDRVVAIDVCQDDLSAAEVQWLTLEHLSGMRSNSPPGHIHALAIENLRSIAAGERRTLEFRRFDGPHS